MVHFARGQNRLWPSMAYGEHAATRKYRLKTDLCIKYYYGHQYHPQAMPWRILVSLIGRRVNQAGRQGAGSMDVCRARWIQPVKGGYEAEVGLAAVLLRDV
jgi:hypothetical protein